MKQTGIIILEGADYAGKTTLARELIKVNGGGRIIHAGMTEDPWQLALHNLVSGLNSVENELVILDRLWISELAYGTCYRKGSRFPVAARCLDRLAQKGAALNVICSPNDMEEHLAYFNNRPLEREEQYKDITKVVRWYNDLVHGNIMYGGDDYGSQLVRFNDFMLRDDVFHYDWLRHTSEKAISSQAKLILERLRLNIFAQDSGVIAPGMNYIVGHTGTAEICFVGEEKSPASDWPWPFIWPEQMSSAHYFNSILHRLGFDETKGLWVNAKDAATQPLLYITLHHPRLKYVALGKVAAEVLSRQGVPFTELRHPQYVRRFNHDDPTYVDEIRKAITL